MLKFGQAGAVCCRAPYQGGARRWQNQSPMTGRRSMIVCSKSWQNDPHLSGPAHSVAAAAGYPSSCRVDSPIWLVTLSATFAATPTGSFHPPRAPLDKQSKIRQGAAPRPVQHHECDRYQANSAFRSTYSAGRLCVVHGQPVTHAPAGPFPHGCACLGPGATPRSLQAAGLPEVGRQFHGISSSMRF